jgi:hypothetical protein
MDAVPAACDGASATTPPVTARNAVTTSVATSARAVLNRPIATLPIFLSVGAQTSRKRACFGVPPPHDLGGQRLSDSPGQGADIGSLAWLARTAIIWLRLSRPGG